MKSLTIFTQSYEQALRAFTNEGTVNGWLTVRYEGTREGLFCLCCAFDINRFIEPFAALLENIAVQENPIYRHSAKLTALAQELRQTEVHTEITTQLRHYLCEYNRLHVEGYAAFRMTAYREKLDMMVYSLIKKLKLTE